MSRTRTKYGMAENQLRNGIQMKRSVFRLCLSICCILIISLSIWNFPRYRKGSLSRLGSSNGANLKSASFMCRSKRFVLNVTRFQDALSSPTSATNTLLLSGPTDTFEIVCKYPYRPPFLVRALYYGHDHAILLSDDGEYVNEWLFLNFDMSEMLTEGSWPP